MPFAVGSIASSWITFGTLKWDSEWSWRLPTLFQAFGPMLLFVCTFFIPESPRKSISAPRGRPCSAFKRSIYVLTSCKRLTCYI